MAGYRSSRVLPVALVLIIVAVAIAALVSLARAVFFPNSQTAQTDSSHENLVSLSIENAVSVTVRGPIVADEKFHSYKIKITPTSRVITTYVGYLDKKVDEISLPNNTPAYEEFVYALDRAGFVKGSELTGDSNDLRGICASGRVYEFELSKNNNTIKKLWTTNCKKGPKGSLTVSYITLRALFIKQVPGANDIISKISI